MLSPNLCSINNIMKPLFLCCQFYSFRTILNVCNWPMEKSMRSRTHKHFIGRRGNSGNCNLDSQLLQRTEIKSGVLFSVGFMLNFDIVTLSHVFIFYPHPFRILVPFDLKCSWMLKTCSVGSQ